MVKSAAEQERWYKEEQRSRAREEARASRRRGRQDCSTATSQTCFFGACGLCVALAVIEVACGLHLLGVREDYLAYVW